MGTIRPLATPPERSASASGTAMDRKIEKQGLPVKRLGLAVLALALLLAAWFMLSPQGRGLTIADNRLMLSPVTSGLFEDTIPVRARVAPLKTVFLDAIQG